MVYQIIPCRSNLGADVNHFAAMSSKMVKKCERRMTMKAKMIRAILLASILTLVWGSAAWAGQRSRERSQQRIQQQTRRVDRGGRKNNNQRYASLGMNTNQSRAQGMRNRRENRQMQRIRNGVHKVANARNGYRRRLDRIYDRAASDSRPNRYYYWHHPKRHPRPVAYTYHDLYPTQGYPRVRYKLSGSINEPGWTLLFSTGRNW